MHGMTAWDRIAAALILSFGVGVVIASVNGLGVVEVLQGSAVVALIAGALVAVLAFGVEKAEDKGYPGWLGFLLALFLNVVGLAILTVLPRHTTHHDASRP